jgi:hypothetical protein
MLGATLIRCSLHRASNPTTLPVIADEFSTNALGPGDFSSPGPF